MTTLHDQWNDPELYLAFDFRATRLHEYATNTPSNYAQAVDHFTNALKETLNNLGDPLVGKQATAGHCITRYYFKNGQMCTEVTCYDDMGNIIHQEEFCVPVTFGPLPPMGGSAPEPPQAQV